MKKKWVTQSEMEEKARQKLARGTWQHAMLRDNLKALSIASALMRNDPRAARCATRNDLEDAVRAVVSMADRTEKAQAKLDES